MSLKVCFRNYHDTALGVCVLFYYLKPVDVLIKIAHDVVRDTGQAQNGRICCSEEPHLK